jgi:hypothetical protein
MDVKLLLPQGRSQRQVARFTGSRNAVARLAEQGSATVLSTRT